MLSWWLACAAPDVPERAPQDGLPFDPSPSADWYATPFPAFNLLEGGLDPERFPGRGAVPYLDAVVATLAGVDRWAGTAGVVLPLEQAFPLTSTRWVGLQDDPVRLLDADGRSWPIDVAVVEPGHLFGPAQALVVQPVQGVPLPAGRYTVAVSTRLDPSLPASEWMARLARGGDWIDATPATVAAFRQGLALARGVGWETEEIAALVVYDVGDPVPSLARAVAAYRGQGRAPERFERTDVFDAYCVFEGKGFMPELQAGELPYTQAGGGWILDSAGVPILQGLAEVRVWVTWPRDARSEPRRAAVMVRTGAGGDRPLVDRGPRSEPGGPAISPGSGPAQPIAEAGLVGLMVDGPHAGARNPTQADEQFLMFSLSNPLATRDNVRQTALELALLPDWIPSLAQALPLDACPGAGQGDLQDQSLALIGHSMGATVAPLVVAAEPRYRAVVLSGAGAGYPANLVYKQNPIPTRPIAEALLGAPAMSLTPFDPFLQLLQAAAEPADPPPYLRASLLSEPPHTLVFQGIVDTYILPPMANPVALAWGLDLAGPAEDLGHPELAAFRPVLDELALVGGEQRTLPVQGNRDGRTAALRQLLEDGVEDGHEVFFQRPEGFAALRIFLETWAAGEAPVVP